MKLDDKEGRNTFYRGKGPHLDALITLQIKNVKKKKKAYEV